MTDVERECRDAWFYAAAMWLFRDFWADRAEREYLTWWGIGGPNKLREMVWLRKVRKECIFDSKVLPPC